MWKQECGHGQNSVILKPKLADTELSPAQCPKWLIATAVVGYFGFHPGKYHANKGLVQLGSHDTCLVRQQYEGGSRLGRDGGARLDQASDHFGVDRCA